MCKCFTCLPCCYMRCCSCSHTSVGLGRCSRAMPSVQVVMLGSGNPSLEDRLRHAQAEHPDFFRGVVQFSEIFAHRIIAASDILLMPSRFEPCGLNQMYALRYGTVPVACATGGLRDTILDISPFSRGTEALGTGWTFSPATPAALASAMKRAVQVRLLPTATVPFFIVNPSATA
jgi:glycogen synthase